jgi:hypothetical protein
MDHLIGGIWKPEDTGLQTTDPDKNGFVGRLRFFVHLLDFELRREWLVITRATDRGVLTRGRLAIPGQDNLC